MNTVIADDAGGPWKGCSTDGRWRSVTNSWKVAESSPMSALDFLGTLLFLITDLVAPTDLEDSLSLQ